MELGDALCSSLVKCVTVSRMEARLTVELWDPDKLSTEGEVTPTANSILERGVEAKVFYL